MTRRRSRPRLRACERLEARFGFLRERTTHPCARRVHGITHDSLWIQGAGNGATKLVQTTLPQTYFKLVRPAPTSPFRSRLRISGSLEAVWTPLNNALVGTFDRLLIQNAQIGIYLKGRTNATRFEIFRSTALRATVSMPVQLTAERAMSADLPELQKTVPIPSA